MKKIVAIFSVFALFSLAAVAQDIPKNTVAKKPTTSKVPPKKYVAKKAVKANGLPGAKVSTK